MSERVALPTFQQKAKVSLREGRLRANLHKAATNIRAKRDAVVSELPDWEELRQRGKAIKSAAMANLPELLLELEERVSAAGGTVHWAPDAAAANRIVTSIALKHEVDRVIKVKSMVTDEIGLNRALAGAGVQAFETDLAELIIQLAKETPSHLLVPAIHKNRTDIRDLFRRSMNLPELSDDPVELAEAARQYLRQLFLTTKMAISGANFAVADTGSICVVESEGNGRMCVTLPEVLVTVMGIEKVLPTWRDLEVFMQLLPRSSTGERMNPYTSIWTGVHEADGPREFHLVLLDNGRTDVLADEVGRQALHCIRCSACLNVCPVYTRAGGHAYSSVYSGPIGAILTPQLLGPGHADSLPFASTLCGACKEVCPVDIDIPEVLVHLRNRAVDTGNAGAAEGLAMKAAARVLASPLRYRVAQKAARVAQVPLKREGWLTNLPGPLAAWSAMRDMRAIAPSTFREWWARERADTDE